MRYLFFVICMLVAMITAKAQNSPDEIIFKAMGDELQRTREHLQLQGAPLPFYVSYTLGRSRQFAVSGALGGVLSYVEIPWTMKGAVQLFLGNYHRNTNVGGQTLPVSLPAEVDYDGIRRGFWQASDMMYKMSLQLLMKKTSYLKEHPLPAEEEALDELQQLPGITRHTQRTKVFGINQKAFENMVKELSAVFLGYKEIYNTSVLLTGIETDIYKLTSEEVSLKFPLGIVTLEVKGTVKAADGASISDALRIQAETPGELPSLEELKKQVTDFAAGLMALKNAPCIEGFYSGPVMFEEEAVASLFNLHLLKQGALFANRTFGRGNAGAVASRFGEQILDKRLTIKNYTAMETYAGKNLKGNYDMDMEGVVPMPELTLVEQGVFKAMLNGRTPAPHAPVSTGSSRMALMPGNFAAVTAPGTTHILVEKGTKPQKMKADLLKAAKAKGLKYAYIVRTVAGMASKIYRVDVKSGETTQVRGANIPFITFSQLMNLGDISSEERVDNYWWNNTCFASMIYPSAITIDRLDISKVTATPEKEPELKYPLQR